MLEIATPADDPNQIIEPPKPTAYARYPQSYAPCLSASAVSGMLSNTAETKPRPSAVCHDAAGSFSTGIGEAQVISKRRNALPLNAPGSSDHAGLRHSAAMRIAAHTAAPMNGKRSEYALNFTLTITLTMIAASRMDATIATRGQSTRAPAAAPCVIGE